MPLFFLLIYCLICLVKMFYNKVSITFIFFISSFSFSSAFSNTYWTILSWSYLIFLLFSLLFVPTANTIIITKIATIANIVLIIIVSISFIFSNYPLFLYSELIIYYLFNYPNFTIYSISFFNQFYLLHYFLYITSISL